MARPRSRKIVSQPFYQFWQDLEPASTDFGTGQGPYQGFYPARLPDGRWLKLPIRVLPGDGRHAVASLIINQASFAVEDALAAVLAERLAPARPDWIIGVPTLGLPLAANVARRLGHTRLIALGTSRKFWYDEAWSEPLASITSPGTGLGHAKRIYFDPRMKPLVEGARIAVVDDVISTGSSMAAVLRLLRSVGIEPVAVGCAMLQGGGWRTTLATPDPAVPGRIAHVIASPRLHLTDAGGWVPDIAPATAPGGSP